MLGKDTMQKMFGAGFAITAGDTYYFQIRHRAQTISRIIDISAVDTALYGAKQHIGGKQQDVRPAIASRADRGCHIKIRLRS